jgi:hypothetical protein
MRRLKKTLRVFCVTVLLGLTFTSCIHPKIKFQKAKLLDPMMDPAKTEGFYQSLLNEPASMVEHGTSSVGGAVGAACPTCGG